MSTVHSKRLYLVLTVLFSSLVMILVDGIWQPAYFIKSAIKIVLFLLLPLGFFLLFPEEKGRLRQLFVPRKRDFLLAAGLGAGVFVVILLAYYCLGQFIDLSGIRAHLGAGMGVNAHNFLYVALYISFINSLLEEFFFRGYAFLLLRELTTPLFAYVFSAAFFAVYHVGIIGGWFGPALYLLALLGLFVGGCLFNFLNDRCGNIYPSWLVHMCANFAINTIGLVLFGIL